MALTYAGVQLPLATPEVISWFNRVDPMDLFRRWDAWNFEGSGLENLPTPSIPLPPRFQLGVLTWPRGASRPPWFHFIATPQILTQINEVGANPDGTRVLHMSDGRPGYEINANMLMLPPIPLNTFGDINRDGLLITLTDQRFYLQWDRKKIGPYPSNFPGSWEEMYLLLAENLTGFIFEFVPSVYQTPSQKWVSYYQPTGTILDAVANQVGQRIVFGLDGNAQAISWQTASLSSSIQYELSSDPLAGGEIDVAAIGAFVPANIRVLFGNSLSAETPPEPLAIEYTLAGLGITDYGDAVGFPGRSGQVVADYSYDGTNEAEMNAYALQAAEDWYGWRLPNVDIAWPGIEPWEPSGWEDVVEWTYQIRGDTPFASTRLIREPWSDFTSGGIPNPLPGSTGAPGCPVWYTVYHHLQEPEITAGAILPPETLVGYLAEISGGAHSHFSLCDGSTFLDIPLQSTAGQTLDIVDWLPWEVMGERAAVPGPAYYPPRFQGTTDQQAAVAYIKSVFSLWLDGSGSEDYVFWYGSTEHYLSEYYANDIYPPGVTPGTGDQTMADTPVYLAIKNDETTFNITNEVVFAGFIDDAVQYMVIVKHTPCPCCGPIDFEITEKYDEIVGYTWQKIAFNFSPYTDPKEIPYVVVNPPITGQRLFEVNDNRSLLPGTRGQMWPTPVGYKFTTQEEFPAVIDSYYLGIQGYKWFLQDDPLINGYDLFDISGNEELIPGDVVWARRRRTNGADYWAADRPPTRYDCGITYDILSGVTYFDPTTMIGKGLYLTEDAKTGCFIINAKTGSGSDFEAGCGLTFEGGILTINNAELADNALVTSLVPVGPCSIGIDFTVEENEFETLLNDVTFGMVGGKLQLEKTVSIYKNVFNPAGLPLDRVKISGPDTVTYEVDPCDLVACCDAEELVMECEWLGGVPPVTPCPAVCLVQIDSTVTGGVGPYTYDWDWGDGSDHSTEADPSHSYSQCGTFTPIGIVTDKCGNSTFCIPGSVVVAAYYTLYDNSDDSVVCTPFVSVDGGNTYTCGDFTLTRLVPESWTLTVEDSECVWTNTGWDGMGFGNFTSVTEFCGALYFSCQGIKKYDCIADVCIEAEDGAYDGVTACEEDCGGVADPCCPAVLIPTTLNISFAGGTNSLVPMNGYSGVIVWDGSVWRLTLIPGPGNIEIFEVLLSCGDEVSGTFSLMGNYDVEDPPGPATQSLGGTAIPSSCNPYSIVVTITSSVDSSAITATITAP